VLSPTEASEKVVDRDSFLAFVEILESSRRGEVLEEQRNPRSPWVSPPGGWENARIEDFLEAARAWAVDSSGKAELASDSNPWRWFARFLLAGAYYE